MNLVVVAMHARRVAVARGREKPGRWGQRGVGHSGVMGRLVSGRSERGAKFTHSVWAGLYC